MHWPFCERKCPYCDFNSHVRDRVDDAAYRQAYIDEIAAFERLTGKRRVNSIFFGGGTPSLMSPGTVATIIDKISGSWALDSDCEITLEANPSSAEATRFRGYRDAGVNRLSLGVQSFEDAALDFLGRLHSAEEARRALATAADIFSRVSFDMIYALPGQEARAWQAELREALTLADGHMSLYQLTIEEGTQFHSLARRGRLVTPGEDASLRLYQVTQDLTRAAGLPAYEISNHARPGQEARHNLHVWRGGEYIGIGPGAHGRLKADDAGWFESTRPRKPEHWLRAVEAQPLDAGLVHLTASGRARELLLLGLRLTQGVSLDNVAEATALNIADFISETACRRLCDAGLLELSEDRLRTTGEGRNVLNSLVAEVSA